MESIKTLYKIGYGPSSSHTMGPGYAAEKFLNKNITATHFKVELYGSLALTGKGHMTDAIIKKVLGENRTEVIFNYTTIFSYHPNAMHFWAYNDDKVIDEWQVYSIGGGDLREEGEARATNKKSIYPHNHMEDIIAYCQEEKITLPEYVKRFEDDNIEQYLYKVMQTMKNCIQKGIVTEGVLPGRLKLPRKAAKFYHNFLKTMRINELIYAYSQAVSEENASGNVVVTAPTCGSAGVLPGVIFAFQYFEKISDELIIKALMVAGLIGNIVRTNASISGAEVGCQGEIGVACSMASAALTFLHGGSTRTIEYGAEIALEHHLGLTCDPVDGLVQIPCIERNAIAALSACNSADYAILSGSKHTVTLDSVIEVMKETGKDLQDKYKETSTGGLALRN